jgi:hypothetical protein
MSKNSEKVAKSRRLLKEKSVLYKGGKCVNCGYNKCYSAMEFHHKDPSQKDFQMSKTTRSLISTLIELDKTILLCSNCHRELHSGLFNVEDLKDLGPTPEEGLIILNTIFGSLVQR